MQSRNDKLLEFYEAINRYAERQRLQILCEMEEQSGRELARAEQEALSDAYRLIQRETDEMRALITRDLAAQEYNGRRALFEQRVEIERRIFAAAADRLRDFTATDDYPQYLLRAVRAAAKAFSAAPGDTVFHLRSEDMRHSDTIREAYGYPCTVCVDDTIELGGLLSMNEQLGIALDATLDARLAQQHEWFCENANLPIE